MYKFIRGFEEDVTKELNELNCKFEIISMTSSGNKIVLLIKIQNKGK